MPFPPTPSNTPSNTPTPSVTPSVTPTVTPSNTSCPTTATPTPSITATITPTVTTSCLGNQLCPESINISNFPFGTPEPFYSGTYNRLYSYTGGTISGGYMTTISGNQQFVPGALTGTTYAVYGRFLSGTTYQTLLFENVILLPSNTWEWRVFTSNGDYITNLGNNPSYTTLALQDSGVNIPLLTDGLVSYPEAGTWRTSRTISYPCICPTTTPTNTVTPTITPSFTPTTSLTPSLTQTSTVTLTPTKTPTLTPTITPSSTPICCYQYEITNYYTTTQTVNYTDCNGTPSSVNATGNGNQTIVNCAVEGSLSFSGTTCDGGTVDCVTWVAASSPCGGCV